MGDWLDVSDTTPVVSYAVSGTAYTVPFVFFANSDLVVKVDGFTKTLNVDYTVSGAQNPAGGTVTFGIAPTGAKVTIQRVLPIALTTHIPPSGPLDVAGINIQFSRLVAMLQQEDVDFDRALRVP